MPATAVPVGALSVVVPVSPPLAAYTPLVTASWATATGVPSGTQTPSQFTVLLSVPAPANAFIYSEIFPGPATPILGGQLETLQTYLDDLRRLLHDPNDRYWSQSDKTVYINKGMQRRDLDTGANRQLLPVTLTVGQDLYDFSVTGQAQVFDVIGINLIFQNLRVVMDQFSYTAMNVRVRQYMPGLQYAPLAWCRYGPSQVLFGPVPSLAYDTEWDCSVYSSPLVNLTDVDPLPYPYTIPVPFYAAYWAKQNERQLDEADAFHQQYQQKIQAAVNSRVGMLPSAYGGSLTMVR